ncbi:Fc receptor-like A isoform X1 [Rhinatrema bivittatum]|uniref:Fc receptor-like A isoform X1 n=1 Tax=Rhinatrema bivittatum TaxID=194408 RepID=UPI00112B35DF|nr:Fc receptor-like A isoform X1 [Rhinatrema bivittatum]
MLNESRSFLQQDVFCSVIGGAMSAWAGLLCLFAVIGSAVSIKAASGKKALLTLDPPWSTVLTGDSVTLMCGLYSAEALYTWYQNSSVLVEEKGKNLYHLTYAKTTDSGEYGCKVSGYSRSDPVPLIVSDDVVVLQAQPAVFAGDTLALRCRQQERYIAYDVGFEKDGQKLLPFHDERNTLLIPNITVGSGTYGCEMELRKPGVRHHKSAAVRVNVRELFGPPVLEVKPSAWAVEGALVSLKCKAELAPQRRDTKLRYSFYKGPRALVERSDSPEYSIKEMQFDNSGDYFCLAQTENLFIHKESPSVQIRVQNSISLTDETSTSPAPAPSPASPTLERCSYKPLGNFCEEIVGHQVKASKEDPGDETSILASIKKLVKAIQEDKTAEARPACTTDPLVDGGKIAVEMQTISAYLASITGSLRQIASSLRKAPVDDSA